MPFNQNQLYKESAAVLEAQLACAESLFATSSEIQTLIESGKFELVQERYFSRGEILNMMVSLDQQMGSLLAEAKRVLPEKMWQSLIHIGRKVHELMLSIMSLDSENRSNVEKKCEEIRQALGNIRGGGYDISKNRSDYTYQLNRPNAVSEHI